MFGNMDVSNASMKTTTILVADDDVGYRFIISNFLRDYGYHVIEAANESEIKSQASEANLWVFDVRLPTSKLEGIIVAKELLDRSIYPQYPILFMSVLPESMAYELQELKERSIPYEWIKKPFEIELLLSKIEKYIQTKPKGK